jgi:hypothetical protein
MTPPCGFEFNRIAAISLTLPYAHRDFFAFAFMNLCPAEGNHLTLNPFLEIRVC